MSENNREVIFVPGCFDEFDGTQEELDALTSELTRMFSEMSEDELLANSVDVDWDETEDGDLDISAIVPRSLQ